MTTSISIEFLKTEEDRLNYLNACLKNDDSALILHALGVIARSRDMSQLAHDIGIPIKDLDVALSVEGDPEFATVMKVIKALGLKLQAMISQDQAAMDNDALQKDNDQSDYAQTVIAINKGLNQAHDGQGINGFIFFENLGIDTEKI